MVESIHDRPRQSITRTPNKILAAFLAQTYDHTVQHLPRPLLAWAVFHFPCQFNIFNRLCDTLVLLALAYARHYPDQPFCPWLLGTEFVKHFFGLVRTMLPNFMYSEFLKMVQHIMVRQRILMSGKFKTGKECNSRPLCALRSRVIRRGSTDSHVTHIPSIAYASFVPHKQSLARRPRQVAVIVSHV